MSQPSLVIVSPAAPGANNGNARTAERWRELLAARWDARVATRWPDAAVPEASVMIALHARRSADAILAWTRAAPRRPLVVVLTGTDLYRDIHHDAAARASLELADRLVVLQERGMEALPPPLRAKARVVFQSTPALAPVEKSGATLEAVMVGHLRGVKAPEVLFEAARRLRAEEGIRITHIGHDDEDPVLGAQARATAAASPSYAWLGALPHDATRERIRRAHLLVHTSILEGGAHVIMEAVRSGTPVLATRVDGNVGMLGEDYAGYFEAGDAAALAAALRECRRTQHDPAGLLARLAAQCARRAGLFDARAEQAALLALLEEFTVPP